MHQHHAGAARFYAFAGYQLDLRRMGLLREGRELKLRPKSFDVLRYLVEHAGAVVTKDELLGHVWADTAVTEDALVQCLVDIRRALGAEGSRLVRTVPRRGYLFEADVKVLDVDAVGMVVNASSPASPAAGSLAVLPFHPLAKDESDHFELGLTDALITRLSMARGLVVRPWTSVQLYIASTKDPIQVGGELGVESVLEGTVQRVDARIRVTGRLYRAADGRLLWWGTFDDDASDALAVQDSISEKVARALYVELGQKPRPRVPREAFEAYARGRYFFERYTREGNTKAVEYFEQATALAPDFALAHAALAVNYGPMLVRGFISLEDALPKLESAAHRAMELDDTLPEANLAMAELHGRLGRWDASERFYRRALELNPNLLTAWGHYTFLLHALGRHEEGLAGSARLLEMDPVSDYGGKDHANSLI